MNNNRGSNNNNRRRGRGNNRPNGGGGGGQQINRVDSRARGNAPQMLEKYKKLAHDAHLNGDRVQEESYLQYADHYFRVIADTRQRQEEQRQPRTDRWQENGEPYRDEGDDSSDFGPESEYAAYEQQNYPRRDNEDRPRNENNERPRREVEDRPRNENVERPRREDRPRRDDRRPERAERQEEPVAEVAAASEAPAALEDVVAQSDANPYEPPENPFLREARGTRGLKPRREDRRPRRDDRDSQADDAPIALDPALLPPSISAGREEAPVADAGDEGEAPKPRRRAPRRKPAGDDTGEALESVN